MKYLAPILFAALLPACVTDAQGNKHYNGPTVSGSIGFNGMSVGITLVGPAPGPITIPPIELPKPSGK